MNNKLYRFSITAGTAEGTCIICTETKTQSIYFAEFINYEDARDYLDKCFEIVEYKRDYNIYIKRGV